MVMRLDVYIDIQVDFGMTFVRWTIRPHPT